MEKSVLTHYAPSPPKILFTRNEIQPATDIQPVIV